MYGEPPLVEKSAAKRKFQKRMGIAFIAAGSTPVLIFLVALAINFIQRGKALPVLIATCMILIIIGLCLLGASGDKYE